MVKIRLKRKGERKEGAIGNWSDTGVWVDDPAARTHTHTHTGRRPVEKERYETDTACISTREKGDSRGVFLRWRSHALPDFARMKFIRSGNAREKDGERVILGRVEFARRTMTDRATSVYSVIRFIIQRREQRWTTSASWFLVRE